MAVGGPTNDMCPPKILEMKKNLDFGEQTNSQLNPVILLIYDKMLLIDCQYCLNQTHSRHSVIQRRGVFLKYSCAWWSIESQ